MITALVLIAALVVLIWRVEVRAAAREARQRETWQAHNAAVREAVQRHGLALEAMEARIVGRFDDLFGQTVQRLSDLETKPAEVIKIDVPVIPEATMTKVRSVAGPSPKDEITLILMDASAQKVIARIVVDRRKRSPQVRYQDRLYAALKETPEGWVYRRTEGR